MPRRHGRAGRIEWPLEGIPVYSAPDFWATEPDGTSHIIDWKTGKASDDTRAQALRQTTSNALRAHTIRRIPT